MKMNLKLLLCASLVLVASGCAAGGENRAHAPSSSSLTAPVLSPVSRASAELPVPVPVNPPPVSSFKSSSVPRTGKVTAVRLADPSVGWAGGDGWLARTTDGGKHWNIQLQHPYVVRQIFALNVNKAWASLDIGDKRGTKLIKTTDGGKHWKDAGTVPNYAFFHFVSDTEAFSGNARTTDGGKTWLKLPVPGVTIGDAYFHDRTTGWAVTEGRHGLSIRKTSDGGKTWPAVLSRANQAQLTNAIIRSAGTQDAWVEIVGGYGMNQTSYSLFHTVNGGKTWLPVLAHSGAGSGPAPGFPMNEEKVPRNNGASPGMLYVVNTKIAFMGGQCQACDNSNTIGKTTDSGKTWSDLKGEYPGYGEQQIAAADANHVWWICTDGTAPSRMYVTSDGGKHWKLVHTFDKPRY